MTAVSRTSESERALHEGAAGFVHRLGLDHYAYMTTRLPTGARCPLEDTIRTSYPAAWIDRYIENGYRLCDPVVTIGERARLPFEWGRWDLVRRFAKAQRRVFHEAKEYRITHGYAVPVYGPDGDAGLFTVVAERRHELVDATRAATAEIEAFAHRFHAAAVAGLPRPRAQARPVISYRERECLLWTSEGLTSEAIAFRLHLSASAVNYHLANVTRKLAAANKYHAAILALREGLL